MRTRRDHPRKACYSVQGVLASVVLSGATGNVYSRVLVKSCVHVSIVYRPEGSVRCSLCLLVRPLHRCLGVCWKLLQCCHLVATCHHPDLPELPTLRSTLLCPMEMVSSRDCFTVWVGAQGTGFHRKLRKLLRPPRLKLTKNTGLFWSSQEIQVWLWKEGKRLEKGYVDPPLKQTFIRLYRDVLLRFI